MPWIPKTKQSPKNQKAVSIGKANLHPLNGMNEHVGTLSDVCINFLKQGFLSYLPGRY